jgi:hypothetical protein
MAKRAEPIGPKPPLPGLIKMQIFYRGPGTPTPIANNVLHARWADNLNHTQTAINNVLTALSSAVGLRIQPLVSNTWGFTGVNAVSLGGDGLQADFAMDVQGGVVEGALSPSVAVCASWTSAATWRGGKPRTYLPGVPSGAVVAAGESQLTTNSINGYRDGFSSFMADMNAVLDTGVALALGFPSYYHNYAFRPLPLFFPFTGVKVHGRLDSQRRRSGKERYFPVG